MDIHQLGVSKKIFYLYYLGKISFHHAYSPPMSKWLIAAVKLQQLASFCSMTVSQDGVSAKEEDKVLLKIGSNSSLNANICAVDNITDHQTQSLQIRKEPTLSESQKSFRSTFEQQLPFLVPFNQIIEVVVPSETDKDCVSFIVNHGYDQPLVLHIFQDHDIALVQEVRLTLEKFLSPLKGHISVSRNVRLEEADSIRFEVKLLGKVQPKPDNPNNRNVVDVAVEHYHFLEMHHNAKESKEQTETQKFHGQVLTPAFSTSNEMSDSADAGRNSAASPKLRRSNQKSLNLDFDKNKTRIFQVGKQSLTLIAPDQLTRNVEIMFNHIDNCLKGSKYPDHFGISVEEVTYHGRRASKEEAKLRCFVFKCSDESVCNEILQATKQASSTCLNGPDPMLRFQSLCRRMNTPANETNIHKFEKGMAAATRCIAEFNQDEQKKVRHNIDKQCIASPPQSRYEHLVIVMDMIRRIYEERQALHDHKSKQLVEQCRLMNTLECQTLLEHLSTYPDAIPDFFSIRNFQCLIHLPVSSSPNAVVQQFSTWKKRAKQSLLGGLENLWEKKTQDTLGPSDAPSRFSTDSVRASSASPGRFSSSSKPARISTSSIVGQSKKNSTSAPNTPLPMVTLYTTDAEDEAQSQNIDVPDNPRISSSLNPKEVRIQSGEVERRRLVGGSEVNRRSLNAPAGNSSFTGAAKARSFSTPYLRRLLHILPDVQESPGEGKPPTKMKSSGFSFSKLFRGSDYSAPTCSQPEVPDTHKAIEMKSFEKKADVDHPRSFPINPVIHHHIHEEESFHSDLSSDEDDPGIFFTAQTPARNILQPAPKVKLSSDTDIAYSPSPQTRSISQRRHSAFSEFKPKLKENFDSPPADAPSTSEDALAEETATQTDDEFDDEFGVTISTVPVHNPILEHIHPKDLLIRPKMRKTIHQKIFNKVGTSRSMTSISRTEAPLNIDDFKLSRSSLSSASEIRDAWQQTLENQTILSRIEQLARQRGNNPGPSPLDFQPKGDPSDDMAPIWMELLNAKNRNLFKVDRFILHAAVMKSVPIQLRGQVWIFLYEQWKFRQKCCPTVTSVVKLPDASYDSLLKELTTHQHAILIDLGRTFPTHPYFCRQLGNGQLALYNLLKAYSLVDTEVGYCQGLSFVAGVVLMNMPSPNHAFELLCHLMIDMDCRKLYLPDMAALRVAIYQLSRLLYDFHSDLFQHFEDNDVTLMLFATPWFLTMFASVLSLNLTARIFDMLFLEGISALFKTALSLLSAHKENLLKEKGFENVMGYLKNNLPQMDDNLVQRVINEMFNLKIDQRLRIYEAEYNVLEEADLISEADYGKMEEYITELETNYSQLFEDNCTIIRHNKEMFEQLKMSHKQIHSLRQAQHDMGRRDEQRMLERDDLQKENAFLKQRLGSL